MWREPCSNRLAVCSDRILFDKSYQVSSARMRRAQQIRNSRGGTTLLIPVDKPTIVAPTNKF